MFGIMNVVIGLVTMAANVFIIVGVTMATVKPSRCVRHIAIVNLIAGEND